MSDLWGDKVQQVCPILQTSLVQVTPPARGPLLTSITHSKFQMRHTSTCCFVKGGFLRKILHGDPFSIMPFNVTLMAQVMLVALGVVATDA